MDDTFPRTYEIDELTEYPTTSCRGTITPAPRKIAAATG